MSIICLALIALLLSIPDSTRPANNFLRVAITPVLVEKNIDLNKRLIEYIGERIKMPVTIVQRKTYQEINDLMERGQVDVAFVCTLSYVIGKEKFGMEIIAVPVTNGKPFYYSYVIVPRNSQAKLIDDLKGKLYAYPDPLSNSGYLYPRFRLAKAGYSPEQFFKKWVKTYSHTASIEAVSDWLVDGASIDSYIYDLTDIQQPELTAGTKIIEVSPSFGFPPVVVRKNLSVNVKKELRNVLLGMDKDPVGQKILKDLLLDKFVEGNDSLYDGVRIMKHYMNNRAHYKSREK